MSDNGNNPFLGSNRVPTPPAFGKLPTAEETAPPVSVTSTEEATPASEATEQKQETPVVSEEPKPALEQPTFVPTPTPTPTPVVEEKTLPPALATEVEEKPLADFMQSPVAPIIEQAKEDIFSVSEEEALEEDAEEETLYAVENTAAGDEEVLSEQEPRVRKKSSRLLGFLIIFGVIGAGVYFSGLLDSDPVPTLPLKTVDAPATPAAPATPTADSLPPVAPLQATADPLSAPATPSIPTASSAPALAPEALPAVSVTPAAAPASVVPVVAQESAKDICEKHMTEHAVQNNADAKAYIAQNPDYVKQCVDQVQAWQQQQKKK